jgi:hypothetical protein
MAQTKNYEIVKQAIRVMHKPLYLAIGTIQ